MEIFVLFFLIYLEIGMGQWSHDSKIVNMAFQSIPESRHMMISNSVFFAVFLNNRSNFHIMDLRDIWEQMMSNLQGLNF